MGRASDDSGSRAYVNREQCKKENRKQYVDKIAAVFILQGYLDLLSMRNGADGED